MFLPLLQLNHATDENRSCSLCYNKCMPLLLTEKITSKQLKLASVDLEGYIKFVVDTEKAVMAVGGKRHVDGEELLLEKGSSQENLWGGGYDTKTEEIDFDSMINIRPSINNPSREVLSLSIRTKIEKIAKALLR